jgi:hypothetical protein
VSHPRPVQLQHEHEFEAAHGLPEALPPGERVLWQGSPDWRAMARHVFHIPSISVYFSVMLALRAAFVLHDGGSVLAAAVAVLWLLPAVLFSLGMLAYISWLSARTTAYTLTNRRLVMRVGIVLTLTFNLPLRSLKGAGLRQHAADGTGDIAVQLSGSSKIAFVHLWPHVRPWRVARPEPMLRCVPNAQGVARTLSEAWSAETGVALSARSAQPSHGSAPARQPTTARANA